MEKKDLLLIGGLSAIAAGAILYYLYKKEEPIPPPPGVCEIEEEGIPGQKKCDDKGNLCIYTEKGWMLLQSNSPVCQTSETHYECLKVNNVLICIEQPGAGVDECIPNTSWGCPCRSDEECGPPGSMVTCYGGRCWPECINMLDAYYPKPVYSHVFSFDIPCVANRIEGEIIVEPLWDTAWRNVDIWLMHPDGTSKRILQVGWYPWATRIPISKTFRDTLISGVKVWGGGGPAGGQADHPALREIHLMVRKF